MRVPRNLGQDPVGGSSRPADLRSHNTSTYVHLARAPA